MPEKMEEVKDEVWKKFLRRHWKIVMMIIGAATGAIMAGILVFLWVQRVVQQENPGLLQLGNWTMNDVVIFFLRVIFWEFIFVGIPVITVAVVIFFQWWKKLPDDEREEYEKEPFNKENRRKITAGGSGGIVTFLIFITWLVVVWLDGNWTTSFGTWQFSYLIYSWLTATLWALLIFGVPVAIFFIWWLRQELKQEE
ncbi:MAG: hypothetical protein ACTSQI_15190 [Candidatus Helarchaeota archaeon]